MGKMASKSTGMQTIHEPAYSYNTASNKTGNVFCHNRHPVGSVLVVLVKLSRQKHDIRFKDISYFT